MSSIISTIFYDYAIDPKFSSKIPCKHGCIVLQYHCTERKQKMAKKYELSPEAKQRQIAYIVKYNRENYKVFTVKLRRNEPTDAKLIEAVQKSGKSIVQVLKEALEQYFGIK